VATIIARARAVQLRAVGGETRVAENVVRPPESLTRRFVIVIALAGAAAASAQAPVARRARTRREALTGEDPS
jgi:hypothetical protein